jgi:hypothetical protein
MGISQSIRRNIPQDSNLHRSLILLPIFNFIPIFEKKRKWLFKKFTFQLINDKYKSWQLHFFQEYIHSCTKLLFIMQKKLGFLLENG